MSELTENIYHFLCFLFEGWCLQFLFHSFITPRWKNIPFCEYAVSVLWITFHTICVIVVPKFHLLPLAKQLSYISLLLLFGLIWYHGGFLMKLFLVIQFTAIHELCAWAGNGLLWFNSGINNLLAAAAVNRIISIDTFRIALSATSSALIMLIGLIRELMTFYFIRRIIKSFRQKQRFEKDVLYYLLPATAGVLTTLFIRLLVISLETESNVTLYGLHPLIYLLISLISLTLLGSNVFSFETYQRMIEGEQERAERAVLENQIAGLKNTLAETERQHEKIRAVKHDMNNHMMVLKRLLCEDENPGENVRQYFEGLSAAVDQLDSRIHTGNMVSDAVIGSKFQYAKKELAGIRLDADSLFLQEGMSVKDYDIGIILSNGLDNAIEACLRLRRQAPDADIYITVRSFVKRKMLFLEIENSFDGMIENDKETGYPYSSKRDSDTHGIGLKNIRACAKKYDGDMDCIVQEKVFILSVMLKGAVSR